MNETLNTDISGDQEDSMNSETIDTLQSLRPAEKPHVSKRSKTVYIILERTQNLISELGEKRRNEYAGFGEHIANKLSKYDATTRAQAELKIMQILYDCDMGKYRNPKWTIPTPLQSPNDETRSGASTSLIIK